MKLICNMLTLDPIHCHMVEQILQHPWLMDRRRIHPHQYSEPLSKRPDSAIMATLLDMSQNPYKTWVSLTSGKFDDAVAAYLILQHQLRLAAGYMFKGKPVCLSVGLHSCPTDPSDFSILPRRGTSKSALYTFPLPCEHGLHEEAKQMGQKDFRRASLPVNELRVLHARTPSLCIAPIMFLHLKSPTIPPNIPPWGSPRPGSRCLG